MEDVVVTTLVELGEALQDGALEGRIESCCVVSIFSEGRGFQVAYGGMSGFTAVGVLEIAKKVLISKGTGE